MISSLRSLFSSTLGKGIALAFVVLIGIAFAMGDVTGLAGGGGISGGTVAKVEGEAISTATFRSAIDNTHRQARKDNPQLDMATFVKKGGLDNVLRNLENSYIIQAYGEEIGIGASKAMIDSEIDKIPGSKNAKGDFDPKALRQFLAQQNLTEEFVREDYKRNFYAEQMFAAGSFGAMAPDRIVRRYAAVELESRSGRVAAIPSAVFAPKAAPSDAELAKFYKDKAEQFTIPERRAVTYALFSAEQATASANPTEAEIAAYYKDNADEFAASESRSLSQIIVPTEAAAKTVASRVQGGESLDAVAKALGLSVSKVEASDKARYASDSSKAVADAVFATPQGRFATPAKAALGWYVVKVDAVKAKRAQSLEQARGAIAAMLGKEKAENALQDYTAAIEDRFAEDTPIADVAKELKLTLATTPKILPNGADLDNPAYRPAPEMARILPAAFQMNADDAGQLIEVEEGKRFAILAVASIAEAAPPPLAKVKDAVVAAWKLNKGSAEAKAKAETVQKAVSKGQSLAEAVAALGVALPAPQAISGTRAELQQNSREVPPALVTLFTMPTKTAKVVPVGGDRGYFVVTLDSVTQGDVDKQPELVAQFGQLFRQVLATEYQEQLIMAMRAELDVTRNEAEIKAMRDTLTGADQSGADQG